MALIYSNLHQIKKTITDHLTHHKLFIARDLVRDNPSVWRCDNKKLVYKLATPKGSDSFNGKLEYTRWEEFPLPNSFKRDTFQGGKEMEIEVMDDVFDYSPPGDDNTVIWYINFADRNAFGFYGGNLFAQDESQCLEHPALCSLRESFKHDTTASLTTAYPILTKTSYPSDYSSPISTPILIRGVERKAQVRTDANAMEERPRGLYGNEFAHASPKAVKLATTIYDERIDPRTGNPYYSNIIAIEAPKYGHGNYTFNTIERILATAYSGFLAARFESLVEKGILERNHEENQEEHTKINIKEGESAQNPKVIIHTGNWGCGAYGGSIAIMSCLQLAAAHLAGIDKIIYHAKGSNNQLKFNVGLQLYNKLISNTKDEVNVNNFIKDVESEGFQWGISNGT